MSTSNVTAATTALRMDWDLYASDADRVRSIPSDLRDDHGDAILRAARDARAADDAGASARAEKASKASTFHRTDAGNADRLVNRHGDRIRYVYSRNRWLAWDGKVWAPDALGAVQRLARDTVQAMYGDAQHLEDSDDRRALAKWAMQSEGVGRLDAMVKIARSDEGVAIAMSDLDQDRWALNTQTGIVDLRTGAIRPHDPKEMHSKITAAGYHPDAEAPLWRAFVAEVLPNPEVRAYFQKLVGYTLTGDVGENVLPFAYGSGANGKSVAFGTLGRVLGDYATDAAPGLLVARRERGIPVDIMDLEGFRFVTAVEVESGQRMASDVMKLVTGEQTLKARAMRQDFVQFENVTTLWMAGNDRPQVDGLDDAVWRRMRLIPFTVTIPEARRDSGLAVKLAAEQDGILAWAVEGLMAYHAEGLRAPAAVLAATQEYREESNPLNDWKDSDLIMEEDAETPNAVLRDTYERWLKAHRSTEVKRGRKWRDALGRLGLTARETNRGVVWTGARVKPRDRDENRGGMAV